MSVSTRIVDFAHEADRRHKETLKYQREEKRRRKGAWVGLAIIVAVYCCGVIALSRSVWK